MNFLLFIATCLCSLTHYSPIIIKYIIRWTYSEKKTLEFKLKNESLALEREMNKISIVDEFAKYTKLRRQYTKLIEKCKTEASTRMSSRMKTHLILTYVFKILNWIFMIILMKVYIGEPVIMLPKGCLFPLQNIFSWPGFYENSISLTTWIGLSYVIFT